MSNTGATDAQVTGAAERYYRANTGVALKSWDDLSLTARLWAVDEMREFAAALVPDGWQIVRRIDGVAFEQLSAHIRDAIVEAEAGLCGDTLTTPALTDVVVRAIGECGYEITEVARVPTDDELAAMRVRMKQPATNPTRETEAADAVVRSYLERQR